MNIAEHIARITTNKNTIRAKATELGLAQSTANLDQLADAIEGIENQGAVSATVQEGDTYTIPKGYHNGSGTVSGVAGGGNYSLQSKVVTPTKLQQNVTPDSGYYGLSDVTVAPIPDVYQNVSAVTAGPGDVLTGKVIVDSSGKVAAGTMPNHGAAAKTLTAETPSYAIPEGYHNGQGLVKLVPENRSAVPAKSGQVVQATEGKVLGTVTVEGIPKEYADTADATALAGHILAEKTAYVDGEKLTGTMPDNSDTTASLDGLTVTSVVIPAGYTRGGTVGLTDDIAKALAAI